MKTDEQSDNMLGFLFRLEANVQWALAGILATVIVGWYFFYKGPTAAKQDEGLAMSRQSLKNEGEIKKKINLKSAMRLLLYDVEPDDHLAILPLSTGDIVGLSFTLTNQSARSAKDIMVWVRTDLKMSDEKGYGWVVNNQTTNFREYLFRAGNLHALNWMKLPDLPLEVPSACVITNEARALPTKIQMLITSEDNSFEVHYWAYFSRSKMRPQFIPISDLRAARDKAGKKEIVGLLFPSDLFKEESRTGADKKQFELKMIVK